jgi:superfamily II DNA or RNA helicase
MDIDLEVPQSIDSRDYQLAAARSAFAEWYERGVDSTLISLPTGTGKTVVAGLIAGATKQIIGGRTLFVAHREELITQAERTFAGAFGFSTAIEMADRSEEQYQVATGEIPLVTVGTVQSLQRNRLARKPPDQYRTIIIDEAHHALARSYREMADHFVEKKLLGITATADRGDCRNLGAVFESLAYHYTLRQAIADEWLVPIVLQRIRVPFDLRQLKRTAGDYSMGELATRISPILESLCYNVVERMGSRQTIVFTPDVASAMAMAEMFKAMGVACEYVAGSQGAFGMPKEMRRERIARFARREYQVIVCCDLLVEGYDCPAISCVVVARPTSKRYKYAQMVGRGSRLCDEIGKQDCLLLDLDWITDDSSRDLCRPIHLFAADDIIDKPKKSKKEKAKEEDTMAVFDDMIARQLAGGEEINLTEELDQIEQSLFVSRVLRVKYTGAHSKLYEATESDPVGVGKVAGVKIRRSREMDWSRQGGQATEAQAKALHSLGVDNAEAMSKWGASKLLTGLLKREAEGLASWQQVKLMLSKGVAESQARKMTRLSASAVISDILMREAR